MNQAQCNRNHGCGFPVQLTRQYLEPALRSLQAFEAGPSDRQHQIKMHTDPSFLLKMPNLVSLLTNIIRTWNDYQCSLTLSKIRNTKFVFRLQNKMSKLEFPKIQEG